MDRGWPCDNIIVPLSECNEDIDEYLEENVIALRAGFLGQAHPAFSICAKHRDFLGRNFNRDVKSGVCHFPEHVGRQTIAKTVARVVPFDVSWELLRKCGMKLPFGLTICRKCLTLANKQIQEAEEPMDGSQGSYISQSQGSSDFCPSQPSQPTVDKRAALDNFLKECGETVSVRSRLHMPYELIDRQRKHKIRSTAATAISNVLDAFTDWDENKHLIWEDICSSGIMSKKLLHKTCSEELQEVIKAYNSASDWKTRKQILSLVVNQYSFPALCKFNPPALDVIHEVENESSEDEGSDEDEGRAEFTPATDDLHWKPRLTKFIYWRAGIHYKENGHGLAPFVTEKRCLWRVEPEVIDAIFDYVLSQRVTQGTAFGTYRMKDSSGNVCQIPRVIRERNNEELSRQIIAYLTEIGLEPPKRSFILKLLKQMPANTAKALSGINATLENCRSAFQVIEKVIRDIQPKAVLRGHFSDDVFKNLLECNSAASRYMKSHFVYNLDIHSSVGSHCVAHGCSDPTDVAFQETCPGPHPDECGYCMLVPKIIQALEAILDQIKNDLPKVVINGHVHDIRQAHQSVLDYMAHMHRTQLNQGTWEKLVNMRKPDIAFLTIGKLACSVALLFC